MNSKEWILSSSKKLTNAGIATARLDAEILLSDELCKDRSWIHAHEYEELTQEQLHTLNTNVTQRYDHVPLAYIRGRQEFYGRNFKVSPDTLTPRPETETLVDLALELIKDKPIKSIADIGTGSGCIATTIAIETQNKLLIDGYDISIPALKIAEKNAKILKAKVIFVETDITTNKIEGWQNSELIVANLPYIPTDFSINLAASHEPEFAIYGGKDGLDYYRTLFDKIGDKVKYVLTESLPPQHNGLEKIANHSGFKLKKSQDFIQCYKSDEFLSSTGHRPVIY